MIHFLPAWPVRMRAFRLSNYFYAAQVPMLVCLIMLSVTAGYAQRDPIYLTPVNGILYFNAVSDEQGSELWRSDGTPGGTLLLKDIKPGTASSFPISLTQVNEVLFFTANITGSNTIYGSELWKSDGTEAGTVLVKDFNAIAPGSTLRHLTNVNGTLFFYVEKSLGEYQLWKSNGTEAGTVLLKSFFPPPPQQFQLSNLDDLQLVNGNGTLYFTAVDATYGQELWKSDGSSAGTVLIKDINPGDEGSAISSLVYWNNMVYFAATDGSVAGRELWKSNGTAEGTVLVKDIAPATQGRFGVWIPANADPAGFTVFKGALYFSAMDSYNQFTLRQDRELWRTDGTAEGTVLVKDIATGAAGSYPSLFTVVNGTLFFGADKEGLPEEGSGNQELWKTDGTTAGTVMVKDFDLGMLMLNQLTHVNGTLFFSFDSQGISDRELWKSNGTPEGTILVKDIYPGGDFGFNESTPTGLTAMNNIVYFAAEDGTGTHLWKSDGTAAGTVKVTAGSTCTASGSILHEYWANISGTSVASIPVHTTPTTATQLSAFEAPSYVGENYGQRIRGYICAPATGNYVFHIAGDDDSELWLSTDDDPANKRLIASVSGWTYPREWAKYASQTSVSIVLQGGKKYYVEALHKESIKGDNLAVGWTKPNTSGIEVVPGSVLSPFIPVVPPCTASGSVLREYWANIPGTSVSAIPLTNPPTFTSQLSSLETPINIGDNYGQRIRGYICAPATGNYTFYISGDDNSELWLSTNDNPANKQLIASLSGWTNHKDWTKFGSQKSGVIALQAGQRYYIEALHKEGVGGDNLTIGWQTPASAAITIVPGAVLSPFVPLVPICTASGTILREYWSNVSGSITNIPVNTAPTATSQLTSFETPTNAGDTYGQRISGYICAPVTGEYTFYIASDDDGQLWLSTDDNPANRGRVASVSGWTYSREWTRYASQKSAPIALEAGKKYYIEALHKEGAGGDRLAVGWTLPGTSGIEVIPGAVLSPFMPASTARVASSENSQELMLQVYPNPSSGESIQVEVKGLEAKQAVVLSFYNSLGGRVLTQNALSDEAGRLLQEVNLPDKLVSGMYILKAESHTHSIIQRIVIHK